MRTYCIVYFNKLYKINILIIFNTEYFVLAYLITYVMLHFSLELSFHFSIELSVEQK